MADIAPVKGLIELTDNFTSQLGLAEAALGNFTKTNQESLKAVAGAAGIVAGAIVAIGVATVELGKRGADVNDVASTLEHFAGSAGEANKIMENLRKGTLGTVDNFILAKDAAHLLSAGVKLTADEFSTLGQAAFVLQNRGLGGTKEQLDLVSDALVTGRTKALAMSLGVIDAGDAEENYAKKLGITKDQLSEAGKAEAKRIQVMQMLKDAVKDAGAQERDFGEEFEAMGASFQNWVDDLGSAIAKSDVFKEGLKAVESAFSSAFSGRDNIKSVVSFLEAGAIRVIDFAQGTITMARVVEGAWAGVKTIILAVTTSQIALVQGIVEGVAVVAQVAAKLHIIDPATVQEVIDLRTNLRGMTTDLANQTIEAARAITGHTEFDKTLDKLSANLNDVRGAMTKAQASTAEQTKEQDKATDSAKKLAGGLGQLTKDMIDQEKVRTALVKSSKELAGIWDDYYKEVVKNSGTSTDAQIADIESTFNKQVETLDALDPLYKAKYAGFRATADEQLKGIGTDWVNVAAQSREALEQQRDAALKTYNQMLDSGLHFTHEALEGQLQKYRDLKDQVMLYGSTAQQAIGATAEKVAVLDHAWVTDGDIAAATLNKTTIMVKTLSGELISLAEAQKRQRAGGSTDVSSSNFADVIANFITDYGAGGAGGGGGAVIHGLDGNQALLLAKKGYSFQEIISILTGAIKNPGPPGGPRIPGFGDGGVVEARVGEHGPETVRIPLGSKVYPTGTGPSSFGGNVVHNHYWNINGSAIEVAQKVKAVIMAELNMRRQFGAA